MEAPSGTGLSRVPTDGVGVGLGEGVCVAVGNGVYVGAGVYVAAGVYVGNGASGVYVAAGVCAGSGVYVGKGVYVGAGVCVGNGVFAYVSEGGLDARLYDCLASSLGVVPCSDLRLDGGFYIDLRGVATRHYEEDNGDKRE